MHTPDPRVPFSFELYPARTEEGMPQVVAAAEKLARTGPAFISVTYGAAGSTTARSLGLVSHIQSATPAPALAHLTGVGADEATLRARIAAFLDVGARRFLALRGDPPTDGRAAQGCSAADVVRLIRDVHARRGDSDDLSIAVAAFPNGHPRSRDRRRDVEALLAKQEAGADFAITQVLFDAADYERFVRDARAAGVEIPLLPGVMPITTPRRLDRVLALTGESRPAELDLALSLEGTAQGQEDAGVAFAARMVRDLVAAGAPGIHLYAFNHADTVLAALRRAGLFDRAPARTRSTPHAHTIPTGGTAMPAHPSFPVGTILGYPRIGRNRELKRALEAHWAGALDEAAFERVAADLRRTTRERLRGLGLTEPSAIPESFSAYDQVLDALVTVGALPARFSDLRGADGAIGLAASFVLARGDARRAPLELTKWFDTNYHHLVPEIAPGQTFALSSDRLTDLVREAVAQGLVTRPAIVGPVTLLALAKPADGAPEDFQPLDVLDDLLPVYAALLGRLRAAGAEWVQLDEPALVSESLAASPERIAAAAARAYAVLGAAPGRPQLLVATPYGAPTLAAWRALAAAPVEALALDLVRGAVPPGAPGLADKVIVGGVVDGRNVWRCDLGAALDRLEDVAALGPRAVSAATSSSLLHVPHDIEDESQLDARLRGWIAFADQKVGEVAVLARALREGRAAVADDIAAASAALADRRTAPGVRDGAVRARLAGVTSAQRRRASTDERERAQEGLRLPVLPTTTIGSFPQTEEIRAARAAHERGRISTGEYEQLLRFEITAVIGLQEELDLDVLVHGEAERNDMVQYFAEHLDGFAVTRNGWVQSYGSRATRPSILWGDVSRPAPITVRWTRFAQSLTDRPVKGMLTGPVTILAWSFVRDDQPLATTADQVALALRDEIADLERAGIGIVQVDEPALRELLPLRRAEHADYLAWSVGAFRLATGGAAAATQIHTHLCYSEFGAVIDAIADLDADVTSIEAARSRGEVVDDIAAAGFSRGIGPGVYDIHSPRVPSVAEIVEVIERAVAELPLRRVWVNPDCGLKTRRYPETVAALANIVEATRRVRDRATVSV